MFSLHSLQSVTGSSSVNDKKKKMKILVLTLSCFCWGFALSQQYKTAERLELVWRKYEEFKTNCSAELSTEDHDGTEAEGGKCMLACILRKASIMDGDGFSRRNMDDIASFVFQDEPQLNSLAHQVHLKCEKKLAGMKLTDVCETGLKIHLCLQKGWKEAGFKHWTPKWREPKPTEN